MSEYCEYMWDPTRGRVNTALARSIYDDEAKFDVRDRKLAIKTVRAILRDMPGVDLKHCTDEYITRFLLARKYRTEQAAALIAAYQAQIAHRQDIFGNLTARDPPLQRALRAGIPGVLPARDRKGRCVLVILASQWDPIAVPALSVQRAIFLVLETLIQDPRNQQCGFVAVVDWSGFSLRQGGALGAAALRNLIAALRGRFPARFKAVHFLSAPLYVQATLALVKPFLDEKTRHKIYLHGNNLSTLHEHLPTDILPAELGGTGPAFNPGLWAEPVIHSAMKEAELAAIKREKELAEKAMKAYNANEEPNIKGEKQHESSLQPENEASRQRTPGNGEETNREERMIDLENTTTSECRSRVEENEIEKMMSDPGSPDGTDSLETRSNSGESPLIEATSNKASVAIEVTTDRLDGISSSKNSYTLPQEQNRTSNSKSNKNKTTNRRDDGNKNFERATNDDNREADDRTRFRVYRDEEDNQALVEENGVKVSQIRGNSESEDIVCLDLPSETNSNEFEMISNHPDSDESPDNSLETVKVEKITVKSGRSGSLPEEANLIT